MTEAIGQYIKSLRKERKMTLMELKELSGVSNSYMSQVENDERKPSVETLIKLAKHLGVSKLQLFKVAGYLDETDILELMDENKRLREALEFYADRDNYYQTEDDHMTGYPPEIFNDKGYLARKALAGESNE